MSDQAHPVPPLGRELARVAAQVELLKYDPHACRHCRAQWQPIAGWADSPSVVCAAELRHEPGCPALDE